MRRFLIPATLAVATLVSLIPQVRSALAAGIPTTEPLIFTAQLTDTNGVPVNQTGALVLVSVWKAETSTATADQVCSTPPLTNQSIPQGHLRVVLPAACVSAVHENANLWVEALVGNTTFPRIRVGAVPYAVEAQKAVEARQATSAAGALATQISGLQAANSRVHRSALIGGDGSILSQDGSTWVAVVKPSDGVYHLTFAAGTFSALPTCVTSAEGVHAFAQPQYNGPTGGFAASATQLQVKGWSIAGATYSPTFTIICTGPR